MPRQSVSLLRVAAAAIGLLAVLAGAVVAVGQRSASGAGPLTLANPVPLSAVRYGEPPLKVLIVGDSMAGSLGAGLGELAAAYNVQVANAGVPGCSLSMQGYVQLYTVKPPGWPCVVHRPGHLLATWRHWVDAFRPDVVIYLARSDLLTQEIDRHWTHLGLWRFNKWFGSRLGAGIRVLSARGARVVLMTVPVSDEATLRPRPADSPVRVRRDARALHAAALAHSNVSVYRLGQLVAPGHHYRADAQGVPLRCADGVHLTTEAGMVVAADLFPRLWQLAEGHRVQGGGRWAGGPIPATTPGWYAKLHCA